MMEYSIFKAEVAEKFIGFLPEAYKDAVVDVRPVKKVNQTIDGLSIRKSGGGISISPTIYINDMYQDYLETEDLEMTMTRAAGTLLDAIKNTGKFNVNELLDSNAAKDRIVFQLIHTEQNKEMLADMPHREFCDLSIIYRLVAKMDVEGLCSCPIHSRMAERMKLCEEQLFNFAAVNTKRMLPPVIKSMDDVVREIFAKDGMQMEMDEMIIGEKPAEQQMYVVTNDRGINGAVSMLYEGGLHDLAEKLGSDLYIMPSHCVTPYI